MSLNDLVLLVFVQNHWGFIAHSGSKLIDVGTHVLLIQVRSRNRRKIQRFRCDNFQVTLNNKNGVQITICSYQAYGKHSSQNVKWYLTALFK